MLYRRKILLALIEVFGGKLRIADCQNLLFLFCLSCNKNYYDFFPSSEGCFSFLFHKDVSWLAGSSLIVAQEMIRYNREENSSIEEIDKDDLRVMEALLVEVGNLYSEVLVEKICTFSPHYASRYNKSFYQEKVNVVCQAKDIPCLFTLGYEGLSIDAYLNTLIAHGITALIDVRKNPISRKYGFSKKRLASCAEEVGITYIHLPDLGVPSLLRKDLNDVQSYQSLFEYYSAKILPEQTETLTYVKELLQTYKRIVLTCFEADYQFCHRQKIVECLAADPYFHVPVVHLHGIFAFDDLLLYTADREFSPLNI